MLFDSYWCLGLGLVAPGFCTGGVISVIGVIVFSVLVVYWLGVYCVMVDACVVVYLLFDTLLLGLACGLVLIVLLFRFLMVWFV